ncbi:MAG: endonuclease domain-containing protein [Bacteroidia bacterium]|nr:endonuclease domain-containing protein [Bacteroidia bacterium]
MKPLASQDNYWNYNPRLKQLASDNRNQPTKAEAHLWHQVLKGSRTGFSFMRQRPILEYIVDFFCKELMLVIEVDGYSHQFDEQISADEIRQLRLEEVGLRVIRFSDEEVLGEIGNVGARIIRWIEENGR